MFCEPLKKENQPIQEGPEEITPLLRSYYMYLTRGCNLSCRHCWISTDTVNDSPKPGTYLDLSLVKSAVEQGLELGLAYTKLTGGEPMLNPDFIHIIDYLTSKKIKMDLETNGTLLTDEIARHMKENTNVYFISVSLDGAKPETHDNFRGKPGAFQAAVSGIKSLVKAGYAPQIIISPHRGNIDEIESLILLAESLGASSIKFNPVVPSGRGKKMQLNDETLTFEEVQMLERKISLELQPRTRLSLIILLPPAFLNVKTLMKLKIAGSACQVATILGILGDGELALCGIGRNIPELCFGSLKTDKIKKVWLENPVLQKLRTDLNGNYPGICADCIHATRCRTSCVALNYLASGKLIHPAPICSYMAERGKFPATRRISYDGN